MPCVGAACARTTDIHTASDQIHGHSPGEIVHYRGFVLKPVEGSECLHSPHSYDERYNEPCKKSNRSLFFLFIFFSVKCNTKYCHTNEDRNRNRNAPMKLLGYIGDVNVA